MAPPALPAEIVLWDAEKKDYTAKAGELSASVSFTLKNVSAEQVVIKSVRSSCGCTVLKLPPLPWTIGPDGSGELDATVDLRGKRGKFTKTLTVDSSHGRKVLTYEIAIPGSPAAPAPGSAEARMTAVRMLNQQIAAADQQAVFKNQCANCHSKPAKGKLGADLYRAACAICHNSPHRGEMVPQLDALPHPTDLEFWREKIVAGTPGTLMPAFSDEKGGPLSREQIASLASYLAATIPSPPPSTALSTAEKP